MNSFRHHLNAWKSVLFALFLRELQSKFNDKFGLSWAFAEPFLFIFVMSYGRSLISGNDVHSIPVFLFMFIGFLATMTFTSVLMQVSGSIKRSKPLFAFRQVQPIAPLLVSTIMELAIKLGVIIMGLLGMYLLHLEGQVEDPLLLLFLITNLFVIGFSLALLFAISTSFIPEVEKIKALINRPILFISAVFFSLQDLPRHIWPYFTWNPLLHINELARYACYPSYGDEGVSLMYVQSCSVCLLFLSLACYNITWKQVLSR